MDIKSRNVLTSVILISVVSFVGKNAFLIQTETKSSDGASAAVDWCKVVISSSTYITSPQQYKDQRLEYSFYSVCLAIGIYKDDHLFYFIQYSKGRNMESILK